MYKSNDLTKIYLNILLEEKQQNNKQQFFIKKWPYLLQFHNFNNSSNQLNIIKDTVKTLKQIADEYNIDKHSILHDQHGNATYMIEWHANSYVHPNQLWNTIYQQLQKNHTTNKYIFWKSLLPNKKANYGYFRCLGGQQEKKLGDKFKPTSTKVYFNEYTTLKLIFYGIDNLPVGDGIDMSKVLKRFIDKYLEKIDDLKIIKHKIQKFKGIKQATYYIKYKLSDQPAFQDKLINALSDWHPCGDGYSFDWAAT